MNELYRQRDRRGTAYSEGYRLLCAALAFIQILLPALAAALPTDGHVAGGQATIHQTNPKALTIQQATDKAILNWKGFSIAADEAVRFIQPSTSSIALNRVIGVDPSVILGRLQSNGRIFLINPNGILFGDGAQINVGGLLATTLQIRNGDFMAGRFLFAQDPTRTLGTVINQGTIHVSDHGFVFLVAPGVANEGLIVANLGTTVLGSSQKLTLDLMGDGLINYAISGKVLDQVKGPDGKPLSSAVSNTGTIQANGGQVILSARASADVFSSVVNQSGVIRAQSLVNHGGVVRLEGSDPVANTGTVGWQANLGKVQNADGTVLNTGTIDVSAAEPGAAQGQVTITGEMVGVAGTILVRGAEGAQGGRVFISSTEKTVAASDSVIDTSGVGNSSAGNVVLWSDKNTIYGGTILARGGAFGGNGGNIEVSGHENLGFFGQVNALAPKGTTGTLLLDPLTITVATGGGATLAQVDQFSDTPAAAQTIAPATINAAAANVTLQANNDITVTNAIAMTTNGVGITMQAGRDILVNAGVGTTNGNISLKANDSTAIAANRTGGTTGDIVFGAAGNLSAGTGNITLAIDPSAAAPFSPGSITTVRNLSTTTGNISINSPNTVSLSGAVNAGSGTVTINANTDGAGNQAFTMNAGSSITTTNTTAGAVQINVNAAGGGTGTAALDNITVPAAGTLTVATNTGGNLTGGAITQNAGTSLNVGTAQLSTGNGTITLNNAGNDFGTAAVSRATNVTLQDSNALILGASTVSGTLGVTTNGALTQSGPVTVAGTTTLAAGAANNITLNNAANNFSTVGVTSGNNVNLRDANALILGASTVSGTLDVTTAGALTQSGALTVAGTTTLAAGAANNITLNNAANNFSTVGITSGNNVNLRDANALVLGTSTVAGPLTVTTAGALTQSGAVTVAGTTSLAAGAANNITLNNVANDFSTVGITSGNNVALTDATALDLAASTVSGTLGVTTNGVLTQSGALTVTGVTTLAAGAANNITLTNAGNNFSTVGITSGNNVNLRDANALILGASTVSGTLGVTTNGALTQSGALAVTGVTTLAAGAANNITLSNAGNNFSTVGITSGNTVTLTDANALDLGASTVSGNLALSTGGAVTQTGVLTVAGTTAFTATAANTDILLASQANNLTGAVSFGGTLANFRDVALRNVNAAATVPLFAGLTNLRNLTLTYNNAPVALPAFTLTAGGNLNVTAGGAISQVGAVVVPGTTTLAAGAANSITLNNAANNFSTVGVTSGNNVALTDSNALDLGASTVSGTLNVTTAGAVTQSGALTVTGVTTLAAGAGNDITLNNAANNFSTVGITSGRNVTVQDTNALILGASTVSGTLGVTTNGALTQSGVLSVTGVTTLAAGAANNITLNNAANNFSTVGITSGNNVNLRDANALVLGASTVAGPLTVTTAGALTQSGAVTATGVTTLAAGAGNNITLNNAANNFSTVGVTSGNNVNLRDANALILGASTVSGTLDVTTAGALTQSGALTVAGTTTLAAGAANNITLNNAANNFSTVGITSGNNVNLRDANALVLGTSTVAGPLTVTTAGALTQSGAVTVAGTTSLAAGAANNITLNNVANDFSTVGITSGNNVALTDATALDLAASTVSGTLGVTTNGVLTQSGALTVTGVTTLAAGAANNITLTNAGNNFSTVGITSGNNVNLRDANALILGASTVSGTLGVTTNGALTQSGALAVTGVTTLAAGAANNITLSNAGNNFSTVGITSGNTVTLTDANALDLGASTVSGNLALSTGGAVTQTGVLTVAGTTAFTATAANTDILLASQANNLTGAVSFGGTLANFRDVALRNVNAAATVPLFAGLTNLRNLTLTYNNAPVALPAFTLTAGGNLNVTAGGAISQVGAVVVPGTTTLAAGAANSITLNNAANNFSTVGVTSGNNVALTDSNALDLGASTVSGTLNVTTAGAVTQSGALTVTGVTTLAAGAGNDITLNNAANNFSTVGITSGRNVTVQDTNALILGASTVSGTLGVTTNGALTQSGVLSVTGVTTLAAGAANNITLNNAANNFSTVGITSGNNVALTDVNALILGASTVSGTLGVTTNGALTQSGALNVTGTTTLAAGAANNISLNNAANNFSTVGITTGNNVALTDSNALDLAASTISGTLGLTTGGALTQSGALTVTGATTFTATAANSDVLLGTQANNFASPLSFAGTLANFRDVSLRNVNAGATVPALASLTNLRNLTLTYDNAAVTLPAFTLTAGGNLSVTAGGAITDSGNLVVPGTTTLAAGAANNITLDNANDFTGAVSITSGNNVTLTDINALVLGASTVSGTLNVTTNGAMTQSGALNVAGTTTLNAGAANNITLNNAANNFSTVGVTSGNNVTLVDANALDLGASAISATLNVTTAGALTQSGPVTVAGTTTLSAGAANNIILNNVGNNFSTVGITSGNNVSLTDADALNFAASTVSGTLTVTSNGALTQSGPLTVTGTTTLAAGAGNNITLNNTGNDFSTVGITSGNNVALTDSNALDLGASTVSGTLTVNTGGTVTQSGPLTVTGVTTLAAGAANNIALNNAGNDFSTVGVTSGNNVSLMDATALDLGASTINGTFNVTAGGLISQSGSLAVAGNASFNTTAAPTLGSVNLANGSALTLATSTVGGNLTATTTAGDITLPGGQTLTVAGAATLTPAGTVNLLGTTQIGGIQTLNGGSGSTFVLTADTNLNALALPTAGNITVNLTGTQATFAGAPLLPAAVSLANAGNSFGGTVSVTTASPAFTGTVTNTHNLMQSAAVTLNPGQGLTVTDLGGTAGTRGNITLPNAGNTFNTVSFTGGDIAWQQANAVTIGNVSANAGATSTGALTISANGSIAQTGAVVAAGTTTLSAGAANNITLNNVGNNFSTVGISSGNNVSLTDANALDLGSSSINGALNVNTSGALTQSGALTVTGVTTLAAGAANNITLNNAGNNFNTVGIASGNNVAVTDATALDLASSTISGNLSVITNGAITQSGAVIVPGTITLAAGAANNITLNNAGNNFNTVGITSGNNVAVTDVNALDLGTSTVSGTLNVTTAGALTQSGPVTVAGTTTLAAGVTNNILLNNAGNDFSTVAMTSGNNVSLTDANALNLAASTVSGTLTVASNGVLTQSGALSVTGITTLAAGVSNNITLNNAANNFSTVGVTSGNNVTLTDANALNLGASTVSGTLNVTTNGALTQSGALNVTGTTTLTAGAGNNLTLTNAANDFSTVGIISGNNVALTDSNALDLGASTVSGTLTVNTGGAVTQSGPLTVTGATTLAAGAANNITLNNAGNDFSTVGITSGNNVALVDANALTLNASTASGTVSVNATDLTVGGAVSSTGGSLNLSGANTVIQLANLTVNGANNVTVTTTTGPITMAPAATTTSGAGVINYTAGTDVTLGSLVTGGAVNVTANGGSVLSAAGSSTNVTAGLNSTVQALGGVTSVTGTILAPITVNVIGGTLGVAVAGAVTETVGAVSGVFTGTVSPSNTIALLNNPPGFVLFNSTILNPLPIPGNPLLGVGLLSEFSGYLNPEVYIPAFYLAPSGAVTINDITPLYIPQTLLAESPVSLNGDKQAVARGIPPCFPESGCRPGASVLTVPPDAESLELPAAK